MSDPDPRFRRILLKLSGEALMGKLDFGTDPEEVDRIARQLVVIRERGVEVAIVVGAGNIYRGIDGAAQGMDRTTGDYMGMMATVLNALTLQDALEMHAEAILMAKNGVEGVFDCDPATNPDAKFIPEITHREAIERGLKVMDSTALSLCMDNDLPIYVFNMADERNIDRIVAGEKVGTLVSSGVAATGSSEEGNS